MNIDTCNGYLEAFASLNEGADHACEYALEKLDAGVNLDAALRSHFEKLGLLWNESLTKSGRESRSYQWNIEVLPISGDWKPHIEEAAARWFFEQSYSPGVRAKVARQNVIHGFMSHLSPCVGSSNVYEVQLSESMWPNVFWEAFAFTSEGNNFLLHFGWSD